MNESLRRIIREFIDTPDEQKGAALQRLGAELVTHEALAEVKAWLNETDDPALRQALDLLHKLLRLNLNSRGLTQADVEHYADLLDRWINTANWDESEAFLRQHAADLLSDTGEVVLFLIAQRNPGVTAIVHHIALLERCREQGIEAAYAPLKQSMREPDSGTDAPEQLFEQFLNIDPAALPAFAARLSAAERADLLRKSEEQLRMLEVLRRNWARFQAIYGGTKLSPSVNGADTAFIERLVAQFISTKSAAEMNALINGAAPAQLDALEHAVEMMIEKAGTGSDSGNYLRERLRSLRDLRTGRGKLSPAQKALADYLTAASDAEAERILRTNAVLLTYGVREQIEALITGNTGEIRARLMARLVLWERVHAANNGGAAAHNAPSPEYRRAHLLQALEAFEQELAERSDASPGQAQTLNRRAMTLAELSHFPGEDRRARLIQALADITEALLNVSEPSVEYAEYLVNKGGILFELAQVPGEDRRARLEEALALYQHAAPTFQDNPLGMAKLNGNLGSVYAALENHSEAIKMLWASVTGFEQAGHAAYIDFSRRALLAYKRQHSGFFNDLWRSVIRVDQPRWLAMVAADPLDQLNRQVMAAAQKTADLISEWTKTPDWQASEAFLREHEAELLTEKGEAVILLLLRENPGAKTLEQHLGLLRACRERGITEVYQEFHMMEPLEEMLRSVQNFEQFSEMVKKHPILLELPTINRMVDGVIRAQADSQPEIAMRPLALLILLIDGYNRAHAQNINPEEQQRFIDALERLLPAAQIIDPATMYRDVRKLTAQAYNTLGNHYADSNVHQTAIEIYTRAIETDDTAAMFFRNRANVYLEMKHYEAAHGDIERAQHIDPDAKRLPELWRDVYLGFGNGAAMLPHALKIRDHRPDEAIGHFHVAVAHALCGDRSSAEAEMREANVRSSDNDREQGLTRLSEYRERFPEQTAIWEALILILQAPPAD